MLVLKNGVICGKYYAKLHPDTKFMAYICAYMYRCMAYF